MSTRWSVVLGVGFLLAGLCCEIVAATVLRRRYGWPVVRPTAAGTPADDWRRKLSCARAGMAVGLLLLVLAGADVLVS